MPILRWFDYENETPSMFIADIPKKRIYLINEIVVKSTRFTTKMRTHYLFDREKKSYLFGIKKESSWMHWINFDYFVFGSQ